MNQGVMVPFMLPTPAMRHRGRHSGALLALHIDHPERAASECAFAHSLVEHHFSLGPRDANR
jgi:hypothetical protein